MKITFHIEHSDGTAADLSFNFAPIQGFEIPREVPDEPSEEELADAFKNAHRAALSHMLARRTKAAA